MHDARDALRDWEQGVLDARMDLLRANAALLDARIEHASQLGLREARA
jgi:hypothetical protein